MKVLFITRKYPPATGGMETYIYDLINHYSGQKHVLAYGGNQKWLPLLFCKFLLQSIYLLIKDREISLIHIGDGVLSPLGWLLLKVFRKPVVLTVYGKDLVFQKFFYQNLITPFIRRIPSIIAISQGTYQDALSIGVPAERITVVPCGIDPTKYNFPKDAYQAKQLFSKKYGINFENRKILVTLGRLANRKGQLWFAENVMPHLPSEYLYLIIGPDATEINDLGSFTGLKKIQLKEKLQAIIKDKNLEERVHWLGKIKATDLTSLLSFADLAIMPNIKNKLDREGFGIVNIEAGLAGLPVVASNLDGIPASILPGISGTLVEAENVTAFKQAITNWLVRDVGYDKKLISNAIKETYSWDRIIKKNEEVFLRSV